MTTNTIKEPQNDYEALVLALELAVTAKECNEQQKECVKIANHIAFNMSIFEVERAKKEALDGLRRTKSANK